MKFQEISSIEELDEIKQKSKDKLQIIFKHSTICPISKIAYEKMKNQYPLTDDQADVYYVGVIEQRPISNAIAEKFGIKHESPQAILIRNESPVFNESHLMINPNVFSEYI